MKRAGGAIALLCVLCAPGQELQRATALIDANTANLPAQRIGANDLIAVSVYASPEFTRTVRVSADGYFRLPMLKDPIRAAGLLPSELEQVTADALKAAELIVDPLVTVTVVEYQSRAVSVIGAVRKPTTFQATGDVTLIEALARAEGLSEEAGPDILVSQGKDDSGDALIRRIPVKRLMSGVDPTLNIRLTGGEHIRVPETGKFFVVGNVRKPGAFPIGGESGTTVLKAIAVAEGLTPYAQKSAVLYRREAAGTVNELPVELEKIMERKSPDLAMLPDDVLYVPDAKGRRAAWTTVERILMFGAGATTALIYGAATR